MVDAFDFESVPVDSLDSLARIVALYDAKANALSEETWKQQAFPLNNVLQKKLQDALNALDDVRLAATVELRMIERGARFKAQLFHNANESDSPEPPFIGKDWPLDVYGVSPDDGDYDFDAAVDVLAAEVAQEAKDSYNETVALLPESVGDDRLTVLAEDTADALAVDGPLAALADNETALAVAAPPPASVSAVFEVLARLLALSVASVDTFPGGSEVDAINFVAVLSQGLLAGPKIADAICTRRDRQRRVLYFQLKCLTCSLPRVAFRLAWGGPLLVVKRIATKETCSSQHSSLPEPKAAALRITAPSTTAEVTTSHPRALPALPTSSLLVPGVATAAASADLRPEKRHLPSNSRRLSEAASSRTMAPEASTSHARALPAPAESSTDLSRKNRSTTSSPEAAARREMTLDSATSTMSPSRLRSLPVAKVSAPSTTGEVPTSSRRALPVARVSAPAPLDEETAASSADLRPNQKQASSPRVMAPSPSRALPVARVSVPAPNLRAESWHPEVAVRSGMTPALAASKVSPTGDAVASTRKRTASERKKLVDYSGRRKRLRNSDRVPIDTQWTAFDVFGELTSDEERMLAETPDLPDAIAACASGGPLDAALVDLVLQKLAGTQAISAAFLSTANMVQRDETFIDDVDWTQPAVVPFMTADGHWRLCYISSGTIEVLNSYLGHGPMDKGQLSWLKRLLDKRAGEFKWQITRPAAANVPQRSSVADTGVVVLLFAFCRLRCESLPSSIVESASGVATMRKRLAIDLLH